MAHFSNPIPSSPRLFLWGFSAFTSFSVRLYFLLCSETGKISNVLKRTTGPLDDGEVRPALLTQRHLSHLLSQASTRPDCTPGESVLPESRVSASGRGGQEVGRVAAVARGAGGAATGGAGPRRGGAGPPAHLPGAAGFAAAAQTACSPSRSAVCLRGDEDGGGGDDAARAAGDGQPVSAHPGSAPGGASARRPGPAPCAAGCGPTPLEPTLPSRPRPPACVPPSLPRRSYGGRRETEEAGGWQSQGERAGGRPACAGRRWPGRAGRGPARRRPQLGSPKRAAWDGVRRRLPSRCPRLLF